jgi:dTMP kinase
MKIIVFEGIDASGKETQVKMLAHALSQMGYRVATASFPRYDTAIGFLIRKGLKDEIVMTDEALHMLLEVDKQNFTTEISKYESLGYDFLILDRFTLSNLAFGMAKGLDVEWLKQVQAKIRKADLTFLLDITAETSYKRKSSNYQFKELDKHELDSSLLNKARMAYQILASQLTDIDGEDSLIYTIDANDNPVVIHEQVLEILSLSFLMDEE